MITGTFYFNGKPMIVGEIPELDITQNTEDEKESMSYFHPNSSEYTFTMRLPYTKAKRMYLSLIYGMPITNNWLKMHGGVMIRKIQRRENKSDSQNLKCKIVSA